MAERETRSDPATMEGLRHFRAPERGSAALPFRFFFLFFRAGFSN